MEHIVQYLISICPLIFPFSPQINNTFDSKLIKHCLFFICDEIRARRAEEMTILDFLAVLVYDSLPTCLPEVGQILKDGFNLHIS